MKAKLGLIFLLLALAMVAKVRSYPDSSWENGVYFFTHPSPSGGGDIGDFIGDNNEMLLGSEASRRSLAQRRSYIGYGALKANQVPCGRRGHSYYNCQKRQKANPYKRGCSAITHCARYTG